MSGLFAFDEARAAMFSEELAQDRARRDDPAVGSVGSVGSFATPLPVTDGSILDDVRVWFGRFVCTMHDADLDLLTLWAAHTWLCEVTYTTPRLVLDSPVHGSGKTTTMEHLQRLSLRPIQAASLSSPALLARLLDRELRTILIDEADRNLDPKREGVQDLLAIINAGYKRGATRPTLVPTKDGWDVREMPTYSPIAMAGNAPNLPDDTRSRTIRVVLMPDLDGQVEMSDWEEIEPDAIALGDALGGWATKVRDFVRETRPDMPDGCIGRTKECWSPLRRVAEAAGGRWPQAADDLIRRDIAEAAMDREDGLVSLPPAVRLLRDLATVWTPGAAFTATTELVQRLTMVDPHRWGTESPYGRELTVQRLGRMLAQNFKVNSARQGDSPRGYYLHTLAPVWRRMGVPPPDRTAGTDGTAEPTGREQ